jgi:hypothetical protein
MVTSSPARVGPRHPSHENALAPQDLEAGMPVILHSLGYTCLARVAKVPRIDEDRWVVHFITNPDRYRPDVDPDHVPYWDNLRVDFATAGLRPTSDGRWDKEVFVTKAPS